MGEVGGAYTAQSGVLFYSAVGAGRTNIQVTLKLCFQSLALPVHRIQHELSVLFAQSSLTWSPM